MRYSEIMTETMKTLDDSLALFTGPYVAKGNGIVVLYTTQQNKIVATARYIDFQDNYWTVQVVLAEHGYGPLLYAIVATIAGQNVTIIPSNDQSNAAQAMWRGFGHNPYVSTVKVPAKICKGYYADPSVPVVGIKSNGSLDLSAALRADQQVKQTIGEQAHKQMIAKAVANMNRYIDDMYCRARDALSRNHPV